MDDGEKAKIERAAESLELSLDAWSIAEGAMALLAERREWKKLERAHRRLLRLVTSSSEQTIAGVSREQREMDLWRALARVYRDKIGDDKSAIDVYEVIRRRGDVDDRLALEALYEKTGRVDDARRLLDELLVAAPNRSDVYERIFDLHAARGEVDRAWCAAAACVLRGDATPIASSFHADHAPRRLPARTGALDEDAWKLLRDPEENVYVSAVYRALKPLSFVSEPSPEHTTPDALAWACAAFGASVVGAETRAGERLDERAGERGSALRFRLFLASKTAICRRWPEYALGDESIGALTVIFYAALAIAGATGVRVPPEIAAKTDEATKEIAKHLSPDDRRTLTIAVQRLLSESPKLDLKTWKRAAARTQLRAAALVAIDPVGIVVRIADAVLTADERVAAAAAFLASRACGELRARLGLALGAPARGPTPVATATATATPTPTVAEAPRAPQTDEELRAAVADAKCEKCGAPPGRLDVFRAGTRAVLSGKCPYCGAARTFTFTVEELVAPAPPAAPPPRPKRASAEDVVRTLLAQPNPPTTIRGIAEALAIDLGDAAPEDGTLVFPRRVEEWLRGGAHLVVRLRGDKVIAFSTICTPVDKVADALRTRFGEPRVVRGVKDAEYRVFGPWVQTAPSAQLAWFARLPAWLAMPADTTARAAAMRALLESTRAGSIPHFPPASGVVRVGDEDVVFDPPIPIHILERALVWKSVVAMRADDAWILRRLPSLDETGPTQPLSLGVFDVTPCLVERPSAGLFDEKNGLHTFEALDAVASMHFSRPSPSRA